MSLTIIFAAINAAVIAVATSITFFIWRKQQSAPISPPHAPASVTAVSASSTDSWNLLDNFRGSHSFEKPVTAPATQGKTPLYLKQSKPAI